MGRRQRQTQEERGVIPPHPGSLRLPGHWLWGRVEQMPQNSGQGPRARPRHSAPPFLLLLLQEGEALGGSGRKGKRLDCSCSRLPMTGLQ